MADFKTPLVNLAAASALLGFIAAEAAATERASPPSCAAAPARQIEPVQGAAAAATGQQERSVVKWTHEPRFKGGPMDRWRPRFKDLRRRVY
jgi:hypothetical protein